MTICSPACSSSSKPDCASLRQAPPPGQDLLHHKIQIDAIWGEGARTAEKWRHDFAGDVSWVWTLGPILQDSIAAGVGVHVCCQKPGPEQAVKWQNIEQLRNLGAQVKAYAPGLDPRLRGFLTEPQYFERANDCSAGREGDTSRRPLGLRAYRSHRG